MRPDAIGAAFREACEAELQALKPGNVHIHASGHGMTTGDFEASAAAAAPHIAKAGAGVGERILGAAEATAAKVRQNTNLGILLLAAPLAAAAERAAGVALREALRHVLLGLEREDAGLTFRAIALADPGGLGTLPEHDVRRPARITLLQAMRLAADRDRIAQQYASDFADVFEGGIPAAENAQTSSEAAALAYWHFLKAFPDSHVQRKFGERKARAVMRLSQRMDRILKNTPDRAERAGLLMRMDGHLKTRGINPGTSADLTVATVFARRLIFLGR